MEVSPKVEHQISPTGESGTPHKKQSLTKGFFATGGQKLKQLFGRKPHGGQALSPDQDHSWQSIEERAKFDVCESYTGLNAETSGAEVGLATQDAIMDVDQVEVIREHEVELLKREENQLKIDLSSVAAALREVQQHHAEATKAEEVKRLEMVYEHDLVQKRLEVQIVELTRKQKELEKELHAFDKKTEETARRLDKALVKRDKFGHQVADVDRKLTKLADEIQAESRQFEETYLDFSEKVQRRRENDAKDLAKYENAKVSLQKALTEREIVRRAVENSEKPEKVAFSVLKEEQETSTLAFELLTESEGSSGHGSIELDRRTGGNESLETIHIREKEEFEKVIPRPKERSPPNPERQIQNYDVNKLAQLVTQIRGSQPSSELENEEMISSFGYTIGTEVFRTTAQSVTYAATKTHCEDTFDECCATVVELGKLYKLVVTQFMENPMKIYCFLVQNPHSCLVNVRDVFYVKDKTVVIMEEWSNAKLSSHLKIEGPLSGSDLQQLAAPIASAVHYLHSIGIVHKQISSESIFVSADGRFKLGCLDQAVLYWNSKTQSVNLEKAKQWKKKVVFVAPEAADEGEYDPIAADVYSFGMVLVYSLLHDIPVADNGQNRTLNEMLGSICLNEAVLNVILACVSSNPSNRPSMAEIVSNEYFKSL